MIAWLILIGIFIALWLATLVMLGQHMKQYERLEKAAIEYLDAVQIAGVGLNASVRLFYSRRRLERALKPEIENLR